MKRRYVVLLLLLLFGVFAAASSASAAPGFVGAENGRFTLDGGTWTPIGYNQYRLTSMPGGHVCDTGYGAISDQSLGLRLDEMKQAGANVVRTWFFQSYYQGAGNSFAAFDRVLAAAAARDMKVIPVLVNHWPDCEPSGGFTKNHGFYDFAFRDASYGYPQSYKSYARMMAQHYRDDQTIAYWQLVNEAEAPYGPGNCNEGDAASTLGDFASEMRSHIREIDPNHLVSLGTIGSGQCGTSGANYKSVHEAVDVCEVHDFNHASEAMPRAAYDSNNNTRLRIDQCSELGKPIFTGESGIVADVGVDGGSTGSITATTLGRRADYFRQKIDAQFTVGMDGYLIWDKIAENSDSSYNLNTGRYGVGRYGTSTTEDPTNQVMRDASGGTTGGDIVRSDFEDGSLEGWQISWGGLLLSLSNSAEQAFSGSRSLKLALNGSGYPAVYLGSPPGLTPGETVTYHLYRPSGSPVGAKLFTRDCNWGNHFSGDRSLSSGWNELTFTVPSQCTPLKGVGLQINNPSGWSGPVYLDRVSWP